MKILCFYQQYLTIWIFLFTNQKVRRIISKCLLLIFVFLANNMHFNFALFANTKYFYSNKVYSELYIYIFKKMFWHCTFLGKFSIISAKILLPASVFSRNFNINTFPSFKPKIIGKDQWDKFLCSLPSFLIKLAY